MENKKRTLQKMPPLKIGNVEMPNPLVLAPMAGGDGSAVSCSVQGAGRGPDLYGNGEREGNFI